MKSSLMGALGALIALTGAPTTMAEETTLSPGQFEPVVALPFRPGNVAVTREGRVFSTVHPFAKPQGLQLFEVVDGEPVPWPAERYQSQAGEPGEDSLDTPLGISKDELGGLWLVDMGRQLGKTRIWGFDITTGALMKKIDLPAELAPADSFVQDLAVDRKHGWIYLADMAGPGILAVELATGKGRRFGGHPSLAAEPEADMVLDGTVIRNGDQPVRNAINPITLSADRAWLHYGAMNGNSWYRLPTQLFRDGADDEAIAAAIERVGDKPVSDGAATDEQGNHYFTNLNENGVDRLAVDGTLTPLVRDAKFNWPDNVSTGPEGWIYATVNQLHRSPAFTGGEDQGEPPYYIYRIRVGTP